MSATHDPDARFPEDVGPANIDIGFVEGPIPEVQIIISWDNQAHEPIVIPLTPDQALQTASSLDVAAEQVEELLDEQDATTNPGPEIYFSPEN